MNSSWDAVSEEDIDFTAVGLAVRKPPKYQVAVLHTKLCTSLDIWGLAFDFGNKKGQAPDRDVVKL